MKKSILALILILLSVPAFGQQYNWRYQSSADCSAKTDGKFADLCFQTSNSKVYKCVPSGGADTTCDTAGEWVAVVGQELDTLASVTARGSTTSTQSTFSSGIISDAVQFDTTDTPQTTSVGQLQWNATDGTLDLGMSGATQQIGQELFQKVINKTGVKIEDGSAVYGCGRQGNREKICLARSDSEATSKVIGITTQDINDGHEGFVTTFGYVRQIKTDYSGWAENDSLYVSKTTAGALTDVEPSAPHHSDIVGKVAVVGGSGIGSIQVLVDRHKTLEELSDINGTPLTASGQFPVWNNTSGFFDFDHNISEFLTSYTETDPIASAKIGTLTNEKWCSSDGSKINCTNNAPSFIETDPVWNVDKALYQTTAQADAKYLQTYTETDPVWSVDKALYQTASQADAKYLQSESDPIYSAWDKDYADIINTPDLSVYVPYTGATNDLDLGAHSLSADYLSVIGNPVSYGDITALFQSDSATSFTDLMVRNDNATGTDTAQARIRLQTNGDSAQGVLFGKTSFASPYSGLAFFWNTENSDFAFATNNTERMRLSAGGNLLLGTSTDDGSTKLQINSTTNQPLLLSSSFNAGDGGSVGISMTNASSNSMQFGLHNGTGDPFTYYWSISEAVGKMKYYGTSGNGSMLYSGKLLALGSDTSAVYTSTLNPTANLYVSGDSEMVGALTLGEGLTSKDSLGQYLTISDADRTLGGTAQATKALFLGSQSFVDRLAHFDNNNSAGRTEVTFSNSGNSYWTNNFVSFMVHGSDFNGNYYFTDLADKTSDGGWAYLLAQGTYGGIHKGFGLMEFDPLPMVFGTDAKTRMQISGSTGNVLIGSGAMVDNTFDKLQVLGSAVYSAPEYGSSTYANTMTLSRPDTSANTATYQGYVFKSSGIDQWFLGQRESGIDSNEDLRLFSWAYGDVLTFGRTTGYMGLGTTTPSRGFHQLWTGSGGDPKGKFLVESTSGSYGQFQIVNPTDGEVTLVFGANSTANSDGTLTANADNANIWAFGLGSYSNPSTHFTIGNNSFGSAVFDLSYDGQMRFPYYTTDGFVKFSSSNGTLAVDTTSYEPAITAGTSAQFLKGDKSLDSSVYLTAVSGIIGDVVDVSDDTVYQAATDGIAYCQGEQNGATTQLNIYTDASNPPTTRYIADGSSRYISLSHPVKKGHYYKIKINNSNSFTQRQFIPLGT